LSVARDRGIVARADDQEEFEEREDRREEDRVSRGMRRAIVIILKRWGMVSEKGESGPSKGWYHVERGAAEKGGSIGKPHLKSAMVHPTSKPIIPRPSKIQAHIAINS
jgi:hypothetical protein